MNLLIHLGQKNQTSMVWRWEVLVHKYVSRCYHWLSLGPFLLFPPSPNTQFLWVPVGKAWRVSNASWFQSSLSVAIISFLFWGAPVHWTRTLWKVLCYILKDCRETSALQPGDFSNGYSWATDWADVPEHYRELLENAFHNFLTLSCYLFLPPF